MFNNRLPVSYYKELAALSEKHKVYIVQHVENKKIFLKKILTVYNLNVYEQLFRHPVKNVPRIYAMYENDGMLTIIEEYISGDTLEEIMNICGIIPESEAVSYCMKLCDILHELHSGEPPIIHRDIKPSNIMLTEDERIVLIDFNAARQCSNMSGRDTRLIGTEGYAAPEQFGFGNSTSRSDIYALGKLMEEITGLSADSGIKISTKTKRVIAKCLEINPKDRFQNVQYLKSALKKI